MDIEQFIIDNTGTIIDVRTPMEYMGGHVTGSLNIPLVEIPARLNELMEMSSPLIFCCASGNRSGQAAQFCLARGLDSYNAGPWTRVNFFKSFEQQL